MSDFKGAFARLREAASTDAQRTVTVAVADLRTLLRDNERTRTNMLEVGGSGVLSAEYEMQIGYLQDKVADLEAELEKARSAQK